MTIDLDNDAPLDESTPDVREWLAKLQGNILKAHGRDASISIFFSFGGDIPAVKRALGLLARRYVTSALDQHRDAQVFRDFRIPGRTFGNLFLSASGYTTLGLEPVVLFPEANVEANDPTSTFAGGMKSTGQIEFGDPTLEEWDRAYQRTIHAMLLLADDDEPHLSRTARSALDEIGAAGTVQAVEIGHVMRNEAREPVEHFGFVDGLSQPLYLRSDFRYAPSGDRVAEKNGTPIEHWDPFEPLRRVLLRDPGVPDDPGCHGSFLVFRKLEQDVQGFKAREGELADALGLLGPQRERAGAMIVGRFRDGTPLTASATAPGQRPVDNDFQYESDGRGRRCPHHAHIRKVNPRGDTLRIRNLSDEQQELERRRRITRRGVSYGDATSPSTGVGLLFMCFQASIKQQFAFIQRRWANRAHFLGYGTGLDTVIGQGVGVDQRWPTVYDQPDRTPFQVDGFVRMKGGEFFFAPSLPFFERLAE